MEKITKFKKYDGLNRLVEIATVKYAGDTTNEVTKVVETFKYDDKSLLIEETTVVTEWGA